MYLIHIQQGFLGLKDINARNSQIRYVPSCVHAAAAIEEPPVRCLHWTALFSQRGCLAVYPISAARERDTG